MPGISASKTAIGFNKGKPFAFIDGETPTGLTAAFGVDGNIDIAWTDNTINEDGYNVWVSIDGGDYALLGTVGADVTAYEDTTSPALGSTFDYKIRAYRGAATYSNFSNIASESWDDFWSTRTPSALILTVDSDTQITLGWTINGTGYDGFSVERSDDLGVTYSEVTTVTAVTATYVNSGLTRGLHYYYRVRAYKGSQYSPYSNIANTWTSITTLIGDGNTWGQFIASDLATITKDAGNLVSNWADKLASGRDLQQVTATNQPLWSADGITFDGADNFMRKAATWNQPAFLYIVLKQITWTSGDYLFDGAISGRITVVQTVTTPGLEAYTGAAASPQDNGLAVGEWGVIRVLGYGVNSKFQINNNVAYIGSMGTANPAGFCIGANGAGDGAWSNIIVKEAICRKIADSVGDQDAIYNYLINKYSL